LHFERAMGARHLIRVRMLVGMGMGVRVAVLFTVMIARSMFMLVVMSMRVIGVIVVVMCVWVLMVGLVTMRVFVVMSTDPHGIFSGQSAAAIFTHYSISKEASSISLPPRKSPLGWWHVGQSPNISSD